MKIPGIARAALQKRADIQRSEREKARTEGVERHDHDAVFCQPNGKLYYRSQVDEAFKRFAADAGVNVKPHSLRRTGAAVL